ncbi:MAG: SCP2 sterol-binding domain-containing protein [Candidatus Methanofastidiosia archaeon]
MTKFPSEEWAQEFMKALNESEEYMKAAREWKGDFIFVIAPSENLKEEMIFFFELKDGKCLKALRLNDMEERKAEFVFEGSYSNWKKLMSGEIDPIQGFMDGKFKFSGNMLKLMQNMKPTQAFIKVVGEIETEFL